MQGLTTCLWFDTQAEDAANFYTSVFEDGKITRIVSSFSPEDEAAEDAFWG